MLVRILYRFFVLIACVAAFPFAVLIAIAIVVSGGFPVLFTQKRVGIDGKIFTIYKFRTMMVGAETGQTALRKYNEADGPAFKIRNDPRFTPVGRWLSHTGLDELPQLLNVLCGDMSFIGPRPLPVSEAKKLEVWQKKRHTIHPGIISPWVLDGYHANSFDAWMKSDCTYVKTKSFWGDMRLFAKSVLFLVKLIVHEMVS
jgi:lipopolysaccharide/colanic/teichoic acid biosynthesis glycosyltransferase